jgi:hypothetical protein
MSTPTVSTVQFADGCSIEKDYIYLAAKLDELDPDKYDFSRMYFYYKGSWVHHDLEWDVRSVCVRLGAPKRQACALSLQGEVEYQQVGGARTESIPGAGTLDGAGAMSEIREVGKDLVACGYNAQVYHRARDGWTSISQGLAAFVKGKRGSVNLNSIDGSSLKDLYAVGYHGRIFHYDGKSWRELESPTNVHLERVRVYDGKVYICGNKGTLLSGDVGGFTIHASSAVKENLWGVAWFRSKVYVAGLERLYVWDGSTLAPLKTGLKPEIGGYRLDARDGVLWSFGSKDLAWTDGKKWHRLPHPDNP